MRALMIDPARREIEEIDVDESMIGEVVGGFLELGHTWTYDDHADVLYADAEGMDKDLPFFKLLDAEDMIAGKAVVIGAGRGGVTKPARMALEDLRSRVFWMTPFPDHVHSPWRDLGHSSGVEL